MPAATAASTACSALASIEKAGPKAVADKVSSAMVALGSRTSSPPRAADKVEGNRFCVSANGRMGDRATED